MTTTYSPNTTAQLVVQTVFTDQLQVTVNEIGSGMYMFNLNTGTFFTYPATFTTTITAITGEIEYELVVLRAGDVWSTITAGAISDWSTIPTPAWAPATGDYYTLGTTTASSTGVLSISIDLSVLTRFMDSATTATDPWNGYLLLWLTTDSVYSSTLAEDAVLSVGAAATYTNRFTGLQGPWQARSRVDECPVCGDRASRETWAYSPWHKRMTCGFCVDPKDPYEDPLVIPADEPLGPGEDL